MRQGFDSIFCSLFEKDRENPDHGDSTLNNNSKKRRSAFYAEELEARVLYSADGTGVSVLSDDTSLDSDSQSVLSLFQAAHQTMDTGLFDPPAAIDTSLQQTSALKELVVIDSRVQDLDLLLDSIEGKAGVDVEFLLLDANLDGIEQISDYLANRGTSAITAIHIVSHGEDGAVQLGNGTLSTGNVDAYQSELEQWQHYLTEDADLLFYGCDLAASVEGQSLVERLALHCDCDVAASDNTTGHVLSDGDWDLEYEVGEIETPVVFPASVSNWPHTLDIVSDLVGHWTFNDGTATDLSVTGNDGTFVSSPVINPAGAEGSAVTFTPDAIASNSDVEVPDSSAYDFGTGEFTVSFWYQASSDPAFSNHLINAVDGSIQFTANDTNDISLSVNSGAVSLVEPGAFAVSYTHLTLPTILLV